MINRVMLQPWRHKVVDTDVDFILRSSRLAEIGKDRRA